MPCPDSGSLWDLTPLRNKNSHSFGLGPTPSGAGGISGRPYGRSQILEVVPLVPRSWLQDLPSVSLSSGFHPETNRQTERVNQDLAQTLRCLTSTIPSSWAEYLP
ncbi:hypothetical protein AOLI_G00197580 [Acnodon oligacanthus]